MQVPARCLAHFRFGGQEKMKRVPPRIHLKVVNLFVVMVALVALQSAVLAQGGDKTAKIDEYLRRAKQLRAV
jgi:hypothetical protein